MKANLHLLTRCNFRCKHCFAKFSSSQALSFDDWKIVIDNILASGHIDAITLAGGEPLLHSDFIRIVYYLNSLSVPVGMITNGTLLSDNFIEAHAACFSEIGMSVDSFDPVSNVDMGRCSHDLMSLRFRDVEHKIDMIRKNSDANIKINTVVNSFNKADILAAEMAYLRINRWKILRMQYFENGCFNNRCMCVTDDEFNRYAEGALTYFKKPYSKDKILYRIRDNFNVVVESSLKSDYIIIDTDGYLVDNTGDDYIRVSDCKSESFIDGFKRFCFNSDLYWKRYVEV